MQDRSYAEVVRSNFQRMETEELLERARSGTLTEVAKAVAIEELKSRGLTEASGPLLSGEDGSSRQGQGDEPKGVGGWLLLLVFGLIVGPVVGAGRTYAEFLAMEREYPSLLASETWTLFKFLTLGISTVVAILGFYAGWGLARGNQWSVVLRAQIILWVVGPFANLVMGLVPRVVFSLDETADPSFGSFLGSVIMASVWTAYLEKSKRVRATYSHPLSP